ncbi:MAG: biopolymer transporter ExbD [Phycisphaerales bacterium]
MSHHFRDRSARAMFDLHYGPNMTPMVDVVMVILIFFMASAALLGPEFLLRSSLPSPGAGVEAGEMVTLRVRLAGLSAGVTIDQGTELLMPIEAAEGVIASRLSLVGPDRLTVLIDPEPDAPYDRVVRLHETCARLGVPRVGLVERPVATPRTP